MNLSYPEELKQLHPRTRNRVRSLISLDAAEAIDRLNEVRRKSTAWELAQVDRVLWAAPSGKGPLVPALFPTTPQTTEDYGRLEVLDLHVQTGVVEHHVKANLEKVLTQIQAVRELNEAIVSRDEEAAKQALRQVTHNFGYSHLVLRKAALLKSLCRGEALEAAELMLEEAGLKGNNLVAASLVQCFQEEQDFLSMKRSIMNLSTRGGANRFTRDISRLPFHPFAKDSADLAELLQSTLQSSLIDSLITLKINSHLIRIESYPAIDSCLSKIEAAAPDLNHIAALQPAVDSECEHTFYRRSSAWLESSRICHYRCLLDHFYDSPEAEYFEISEALVSRARAWTAVSSLDELAESGSLGLHGATNLTTLENEGTATRSALFNLCLHASQGFAAVSETNLISLMGRTRDLSKTIPAVYASNLAKVLGSETSKLILLLLVAKKSRNERDDHLLRKAVQSMAIRHFNRSVLELLVYLDSRSSDIAIYAYEVFTEDFIAKLYDLIASPAEVTDVRASLHRWMGNRTGDKTYFDRARTLLIDHQLNKVRNEIDDNRIYVDVARFHQWIAEELLRDITSALGSVDSKASDLANETVLGMLVERCYTTFCSHKVFGISSYLGRRIRHGTFKGHLYSGVISVEREPRHRNLLSDPSARQIWNDWKIGYEARIDEIIRDRLHVASPSKRDGLLNPSSASAQKSEILSACAKAIFKDYTETKSSAAAAAIITEYCWRLAEVDLKVFNAYLKGQRRVLVENIAGGLERIKWEAPTDYYESGSEFYRAVTNAITEKLMAMQMWFKRPLNVSPKASLSLLYKAVVAEVKETFAHLEAPLDLDPASDIELFGGVYHILYDSFYVVVYNAAKHGRPNGMVRPQFAIVEQPGEDTKAVVIKITSELRDDQDENEVQKRLSIDPGVDVDNAQTYENRSGIPKLYQLQRTDACFFVRQIQCINREVNVVMTYKLEH